MGEPHSPGMLPHTFARLLMDAVLTHLRASLAHPLHGHVPLGAGFPACSLVQGEASLARVAVGGISFAGSARRAAGLTCAVFCVEAPVGKTEHNWRHFPAGEMSHACWQRACDCRRWEGGCHGGAERGGQIYGGRRCQKSHLGKER